MARDYLAVGDLVGRLERLVLECERCDRRGVYPVRKLLEELGPDANLADWRCRVTASCPRQGSYSNPCGARCPDLAKVF